MDVDAYEYVQLYTTTTHTYTPTHTPTHPPTDTLTNKHTHIRARTGLDINVCMTRGICIICVIDDPRVRSAKAKKSRRIASVDPAAWNLLPE